MEVDEMYLDATVPGGPGRCSVRVASDVTAGSYREFNGIAHNIKRSDFMSLPLVIQ